jgi:flagellar basal body rod protein FlgC
MNEFDLLSRAAGAMDVERTVLDIAARNVAAAQAGRPGHDFQRLVPRIDDPGAAADDPVIPDPDPDPFAPADVASGPRVVGTRTVAASADALTEMIGVLDAQRAYEMDASVFDVGKRLAERTIDIGRT